MRDFKSFAPILAIALAAILWGFDGVVLTPRLFNLNVSFVVFLFHLVPFILMQQFFYKSYHEAMSFTKKEWAHLGLIALLGGALGTLAIVQALFLVHFSQLSVVILLQKLQPVFAILLARIFLHEKPKRIFYLFAMTAIIGSYILAFGFGLPNFASGEQTVTAALFSLFAAFCFGSGTVLGKSALNSVSFQSATFFRFGLTALIMLVITAATGTIAFQTVTVQNWMMILLIAVTTGGGAIFIYYWGLRRVKASVSTIVELLFPLSAIFFDFVVNKSVLTPVQWFGTAILLLSIIAIAQFVEQ
ncbi:MAG: DMT family transporter [Candidatus Aenigmarchaeota archaeon]|nr:DMT family transporter [Candidatus Aenigmarchaeota archaeon]